MRHWNIGPVVGILSAIVLFNFNSCFALDNNVPLEVVSVQKKMAQTKTSTQIKTTSVVACSTHPLPLQKEVKVIKKPMYVRTTTFYAGSLHDNVTRVAQSFGWSQVVWEPAYDFQWVGTAKIRSNSLTDLLHSVLQNYPLQAIFYQGNHILVIRARNLS